jgi:hypothetical protein
MLVKSLGARAITLAGLLAASCAHNVGQDANTGPDGRIKGAKAIPLENGEGKAKGIVTYPGGDRVDWKLVELPEKKRGQLDLKLQWMPPRPGLQLAFDVFDEWNTPIVQSRATGKNKSLSRVRTASIGDARGKYFVRVYAVGRGDAGSYKLTVEFKESSAMTIDLTKVDVPDPPKLAAVPEAEVPCDEFAFDQKIPACKAVCPQTGAPPGWPACKDKCSDPPDPNKPACWATMPCPNPPDRRVRACKPSQWPKCVDFNNPDPNNPNCDNATAPPVTGRVIKNEVAGADTIITIGIGSDAGVGKGWTGRVLRGDTDTPIEGGEVTVIRVGKRETVGKVHLTTDQIAQNPHVKLSPPPK